MTKLLAWLISVQKYIYGILAFLCVLLIVFMKGCSYGRDHKKCPEVITNTIVVHDTVTHEIVSTYPHYINHTDTIIYVDTVLQKVDTLKILADYFSLHVSDNRWSDSLLTVDLKTYISENKLKNSVFKYKITRPQTLITNLVDNSIHYNKYLYAGGSIPVKDIRYAAFSGFYAFSRGLIGLGYNPYLKSVNVTGAIKIAKLK
jgi:hypothetical protein